MRTTEELAHALKKELANMYLLGKPPAEIIDFATDQYLQALNFAARNQQHAQYLAGEYAQLEIIKNPPRVNNDEYEQLKTKIAEKGQGAYFFTEKPLLNIGYEIAARSADSKEVFKFRGIGLYTGTTDELKKDMINRVSPIFWQAPTQDELRSPYLDKYGVSLDTLHKAIGTLAPYWHDEFMRLEFAQKVDETFSQLIEPELTNKGYRRDARRDYLRAVKRAYKAMADNRGTRRDAPNMNPNKGKL